MAKYRILNNIYFILDILSFFFHVRFLYPLYI